MTEHAARWSTLNRLQLNNDKCKELRISFAKQKQVFEPVVVNGKDLSRMCRK